jgi:hypothetical protein
LAVEEFDLTSRGHDGNFYLARNTADDQAKALLNRLDLFECQRQGRLRSVALNGDSKMWLA